jgi:uncharacterized protein DUF6285
VDDRPSALELLRAVGDFLEQDLLPAIPDRRLRYQILIAVSALRMAERELPDEGRRLRSELAALGDLLRLPAEPAPVDLSALRRSVLHANRELCDRIRDGLADQGPWRDRVLRHLETAVEDKLRISNPRELEALRAEAGEATA